MPLAFEHPVPVASRIDTVPNIVTVPRTGSSTGGAAPWRLRTCAAAATLTLAAGCAGGTSSTNHPAIPASADGSGETSTPIRVVYEGDEKTAFQARVELVADGPAHIRIAIRVGGYAPMLYVYDGKRLLVHDPEEYRPWQLYDAPEQHPDQYGTVTSWYADPGSTRFAKNCPSAKEVGHQTLVGRDAVGYHCASQHHSDGSSQSAVVVWLDQATGVMLKVGGIHAVSFEEHPPLNATTFDTHPPAGAKVEHYAVRADTNPDNRPAPDFHLRNVRATGPRTISLADYAHRPLVLAFFMSDLTFSDSTEFPRELGSLQALEKLTSGGTDPAVLAIQGGEEGKPGYPLIPKGLTFTVVNDPGFDVQHAYGLSNQVGYAFIGSDGIVHQVFDEPPTEQQLQDALNEVK